MTDTAGSLRNEPGKWVLAGLGVVVAIAIVVGLGRPHPHPFDGALFARQPWVIKAHMLTAVAALLIGATQMSRPKGDAAHRWLGWSWVILMAAVAGSSLFIRVINPGAFSWIHILSAYVLVMLPLAVFAARRGKIGAHRGMMTGLFCFGLLVAGAFTFLPGRLMWKLFLG